MNIRPLFTAGIAMMLSGAALAGDLPEPLTDDDFYPIDRDQAKLGQLLFYDPVLSGNRNISCATCHHPELATSDGLSLGIGEGGSGLSLARVTGNPDNVVHERVPRNAPGLFNLGFKELDVMFHDGRVFESDIYDSGFDSPAEEFLPTGLRNIIAAQALFPITSETEMAGDIDENEVPGAVRRRIDYGWRVLVDRLRATGDYTERFKRVYDDIDEPLDLHITHVANALATFQEFEWRADNSPFDRYLRGEETALRDSQKAGMRLFYGKANCSQCHSGPLQTDQDFHSLGLPPLGPGRTRPYDPIARDQGRINVTDRREDAYRFRTPSLRNVAATAPYGHNGTYADLEGIIRHHLDPQAALDRYDREQVLLVDDPYLNRSDFILWQDEREMARLRQSVDIEPVDLSDREIGQIIDFLESLNDPVSLDHRLGVPEQVPSGLPVERLRRPEAMATSQAEADGAR